MLPMLKQTGEPARQYLVSFRGIHWGEEHRPGDFSHTTNLSTAHYPCLSQRSGRHRAQQLPPHPGGLITREGLVAVSGGSVFHNGQAVGTVTEGRKQLAAVGDWVLIFPDKACYNTATGEFGSMEAEITLTNAVFGESAITAEGAAFPFREGDAVTVSGCPAAENDRTVIIRSVDGGALGFYENTFTAVPQPCTVTLRRTVPDLELVCESNFRLWGTCGSTIYASRYGDPFNFQVFDGLSGDSYAIEAAGDGPFTGCIAYSGHICFFRENSLHKLYGSKPSNFQVVTSRVSGVEPGSERSLCIVNETLFYKGTDGVYAYTGGVPEPVSDAFGSRRFRNAAACADDSRYYLSAEDAGGGWHLLTYDVRRGLWLREDDLRCAAMARWGGRVYLLGEDGVLWQTESEEDEPAMPWSVTFCPFSETVLERKGYSRFLLRVELEEGAWLRVEVRRDNAPGWETVCTTHGGNARTVSVPVLPARCDTLELRLSGEGRCRLRTLVREFTVGSDV